MDKIKIGLVGCGDVARLAYLPGIVEGLVDKGLAELTCVCDAVERRAEMVMEEFGASEYSTDYDQMLDMDIDLIVNLTPQHLHAPLSLAAIEAGKHVYTEKPIAKTVKRATELVQKAQQNNVKIACAPPTILQPKVQFIKRFIDASGIGKIYSVVSIASHEGAGLHRPSYDPSWYYKKEEGGGSLYDIGVYRIQLLTYLLGPAKRVVAFSGIAVPKRFVGYFDEGGAWQEHTVTTTADDNSFLLLDWGNGALGSIASTYNVKAFKGPRTVIFGTEGTISLNMDAPSRVPEIYCEKDTIRGWVTPMPLRRPSTEAPKEPSPILDRSGVGPDFEPSFKDGFSLAAGVEHLVDCIIKDREPIISGKLATHYVEIIEKALQSSKTGESKELATTF